MSVAADPPPAPVASPCVDVCRIDEATGHCAGCLRTIDEIAEWAAASEEQQRHILAAIAQRRAALSPPPLAKGGRGGFNGRKP